MLCDKSESELGILDLIQGAAAAANAAPAPALTHRAAVYVETLDRSFESVCELDLIFNSPKARPQSRARCGLAHHGLTRAGRHTPSWTRL